MAFIPGTVPFTGLVAPSGVQDAYAVIDPIYGIDGLRSVVDHDARNAITTERRREGMLVYTQNDQQYWQLKKSPWAGDNTDWSLASFGGSNGSQGPQGVQGINGTIGKDGSQGPQGYQGDRGYQGTQGQFIEGPQGVQGDYGGPPGPKGDQGSIGVQGPQGVQGDLGKTGPFGGPQGVQGRQGFQGVQGVQGNQGYQGAGYQGSQGYQGIPGEYGGPMGPQGYQGILGHQGHQGAGYQGAQGNQGFTGPQGEYGGPQGIQGVQGTQGNQGLVGSQGNQGVGDIGPVGPQGHQGIQGDYGGPPGPSGPQGVQGAGYQGTQGHQGVIGLQGAYGGPQGYQGVQGVQGLPAPGAAGFGNLSVFAATDVVYGRFDDNVYDDIDSMVINFVTLAAGSLNCLFTANILPDAGSQYHAFFRFVLDNTYYSSDLVGVRRDDGPVSGEMDGVTLHWVFDNIPAGNHTLKIQFSNDYSSQVVHILARRLTVSSSQGVQGAMGFQGVQGVQGVQGFQGFQGFQGYQGNQGYQGIKGDFGGPPGPQGNQGFQGVQGFLGHQGVSGQTGKFTLSFTNDDLSNNVLEVPHNLNSRLVNISIYDDVYDYIVPTAIHLINGNLCSVDLSGYMPISGTWNAVVLGGAAQDYKLATIASASTRPSASVPGRVFYPVEGVSTYVDNGTSWVPYGPIYKFVTPPTTGWTWDNQGAGSVEFVNDGIWLNEADYTAGGYKVYRRTAPSTPWTLTAHFRPLMLRVNYHQFGLAIGDAFTGRYSFFLISSRDNYLTFEHARAINSTTYSSSPSYLAIPFLYEWFRIQDNGTNIVFSYSVDGYKWKMWKSESRTAWLNPNLIGFSVNSGTSSSPGISVFLDSWEVI